MRDGVSGVASGHREADPSGWWLLAVLLLALGLRLLAIATVGDVPQTHGDEGYYIDKARSLVATGRYPGAFRPPGYPALVAGVFLAFGESLTALRVILALVSVAIVGVVYAVVRPAWGVRAALLSALVCAVNPTLIHYSHFVWSEIVTALLLALVVLGVQRWSEDGRRGWLVATGLAIGLGTLTREMVLYVLPFAVFAVWTAGRGSRSPRRRCCDVAVVVLLAALVIAPWTWRNHRKYDAFVLVSTNRWMPVAMGNLPARDGRILGRTAERRYAAQYRRGGRGALERERTARAVALAEIRDQQPWWIVRKSLRTAYLLFSPTGSQLGRFLRNGWIDPRWQTVARRLDVAGAGIYVLLVLAGSAALWLVPGVGPGKLVVVGAIAVQVGVYVIANATHRFRVPLEPLIGLYVGPLFLRRDLLRLDGWRIAGVALTWAGFAAVIVAGLGRAGS